MALAFACSLLSVFPALAGEWRQTEDKEWQYIQEENIELAREFIQKYFVSDGMIADLAIHKPDRDEGGIPNPHFHVLVPIRPLNADGTWGVKQRREYHLDENGNRKSDYWYKEDGAWYYLDEDGVMAKNTWIDNYYVDSTGRFEKKR